MKTKSVLAKVFAVIGTVLIWLPVLFMFLTAIIGSIAAKKLLFDYMMLAEFFVVVLIGVVLLFAAGILSKTMPKWLGWSSAIAVIALAGAQLTAVASGLAHGDREPTGYIFGFVIGLIMLYNLLVVGIGVLGIRLVKRLYARKTLSSEPSEAQE